MININYVNNKLYITVEITNLVAFKIKNSSVKII